MKKRRTKCFCTILHKLFSYASAKFQTFSFDRTAKFSKICLLYLQQSVRLSHESALLQIDKLKYKWYFSTQERCNTSVGIFVAQWTFRYSPQVYRIKVSPFYSSLIHVWQWIIMLFKYFMQDSNSEVWCEPWKAAIDHYSEVCLLVIWVCHQTFNILAKTIEIFHCLATK